MLEKQKMREEQRWAERNIEERENIRRLINAANNTRPATGNVVAYNREKYSPMMTTQLSLADETENSHR